LQLSQRCFEFKSGNPARIASRVKPVTFVATTFALASASATMLR